MMREGNVYILEISWREVWRERMIRASRLTGGMTVVQKRVATVSYRAELGMPLV